MNGTRGLKRERTLELYAMVLILKGQGSFRHGDSSVCEISAGSLLFILPGIPHRYWAPTAAGWDEFYLMFEGSAFDRWRSDGLFPSDPHLCLGNLDYWHARLRQVCQLPVHPHPRDHLVAVTSLLNALASLSDDAEAQVLTPSSQEWLDRACRDLEPHASKRSLNEIARRCGVSYETFRRRFLQLTGVGPSAYRTNRAIEEACRLISRERLSNGELADRLGFCNEFYFSKCFTRTTGQTPTAFRSSLPG